MYTQKKTIDNVHIVRERDRQRFRELLAVLSLGVPVGLFLLLFTWQNLEVIRLGREATRLQRVRKEIGEENKRLQFALDHLTALDSVQRRAAALGFAPADSRVIVTVSGNVVQASSPGLVTSVAGEDARATTESLPSPAGRRWRGAPDEGRASGRDVGVVDGPSPGLRPPSPGGRGRLNTSRARR